MLQDAGIIDDEIAADLKEQDLKVLGMNMGQQKAFIRAYSGALVNCLLFSVLRLSRSLLFALCTARTLLELLASHAHHSLCTKACSASS